MVPAGLMKANKINKSLDTQRSSLKCNIFKRLKIN